MKEAYAVRRTVPPSAEIQASIDKLLGEGMVDDPQKMLSELARLRRRLIIPQAAVADGSAEGADHRRIRPRAVDARRRVAVRRGRSRPDLEVDGVQDLCGA